MRYRILLLSLLAPAALAQVVGIEGGPLIPTTTGRVAGATGPVSGPQPRTATTNSSGEYQVVGLSAIPPNRGKAIAFKGHTWASVR